MKRKTPPSAFLKSEPQDLERASDFDPDREPVEEVAAEFAERLRQGERPSIETYAAQHPELAEEIRELFPAIAAVEQVNDRWRRESRASRFRRQPPIQQLGDFHLLGEIGRGGMGIVYAARQESLGRRVAVKVLPKQALCSEKDVQRFRREAQTAARLHHTNIVPVFGVGEQDDVHYLVMQFIEGVGLDEILVELRSLLGIPDGSAEGATSTHGGSGDSPRSHHVRHSAAALLRSELQDDSSGASDSQVRSDLSLGSFFGAASADDPEATTKSSLAGGDPSPLTRPLAEETPVQNAAPPGATLPVGPQYWRNVARIGVQVASALEYAHAYDTLHRDIKPGNLLLDTSGIVWVVDFGLAKATQQDDVTWTGDVVGTLSYLAPERFQGEADARSDLYSLGLTLYELLTLQRAYDGKDRAAVVHRITTEELAHPRKKNPNIPRDLETIVLKAVARSPNHRYQTAGELAADLECFLEDRPIQARRASAVERSVRWARRNRMVASLAATVAALLVIGSTVATLGYARESMHRRRAEATAQIAVQALENIYGQFAPGPLELPFQTTLEEGGEESAVMDPPTRLPLSQDVALLLENLLEFYDRLSTQTKDEEGVLVKSIVANRRIGDIHYRLGEFEKAEATYDRAIEKYERNKSLVADREAMRLELARIYNGQGMVLVARRKAGEARLAHKHALQWLEAEANSPRRDYELARTHYLLHLAEHRHRRHSSRQQRELLGPMSDNLAPAIAILSGLVVRHGAAPEYRFLLARCHLAQRGDDREHSREQAIAILEGLVAQYPTVPDYQFELGEAYAKNDFRRIFWSHHKEAEDPQGLAEAEQRLRAALEVTKDLELSHPNIPKYLELKAKLHQALAVILRDGSRLEEARQHYLMAIDRHRTLISLVSAPRGYRIWQAYVRLELSETLRDLGQWDRARAQLKTLSDEVKRLILEADPDHRSRLEELLGKAQAARTEVLQRLAPPAPTPSD